MNENAPTPAEPTVKVRMLETVGPTATDRQAYAAGTEWLVSLSRAEQLEADGLAELIDTLDAPAPPALPTPDED